jgi:hypothetical protein
VPGYDVECGEGEEEEGDVVVVVVGLTRNRSRKARKGCVRARVRGISSSQILTREGELNPFFFLLSFGLSVWN